MIYRDAVVLKDQLGRIDRLITQLLELAADPETFLLGRDEQAHAGVGADWPAGRS